MPETVEAPHIIPEPGKKITQKFTIGPGNLPQDQDPVVAGVNRLQPPRPGFLKGDHHGQL
jgi:hypothetical protein